MTTTTIQIPAEVLSGYAIEFNRIQALDMSGEFCDWCSDQDRYVEVQFYGLTREHRVAEYSTCCAPCLPRALASRNIDPHEKLVLEYER